MRRCVCNTWEHEYNFKKNVAEDVNLKKLLQPAVHFPFINGASAHNVLARKYSKPLYLLSLGMGTHMGIPSRESSSLRSIEETYFIVQRDGTIAKYLHRISPPSVSKIAAATSAVDILNQDPYMGVKIGHFETPKFPPVNVLKCMPAPSSLLFAATTEGTVRVIEARMCLRAAMDQLHANTRKYEMKETWFHATKCVHNLKREIQLQEECYRGPKSKVYNQLDNVWITTYDYSLLAQFSRSLFTAFSLEDDGQIYFSVLNFNKLLQYR
ncbi:hypothetical protein FQR65_LT06739 [Abscondita terminalis]|nr:hypothetical protein FQR65_LT06739 [Abscondita terminalis]